VRLGQTTGYLVVFLLIIIRPHCPYYIRSIVTDRVAWSVGLSVCNTSEPCKKWPDRSRCRLGYEL